MKFSNPLVWILCIAVLSGCGDRAGIAVGLPRDSDDTGSATQPGAGDDDPPISETDPSGETDPGTSDAAPDTADTVSSSGGDDSATTIAPDTGPGDTGPGDTGPGDTSGADTSGLQEIPIYFDDNGWISQTENELGVQGSWYSFSDNYASIPLLPEFVVNRSTICVEGSVVIPTTEDPTLMFGAKVGFDLCANAVPGNPLLTRYSMAGCAWSPNLQNKILGIGFTLSGLLPGELRLQFMELERVDGTYIIINNNQAGAQIHMLSDAAILYDPAEAPIHPEAVFSVMFYIPSFQTPGSESFDFCISDIHFLADL